jgi:hypothetical protein
MFGIAASPHILFQMFIVGAFRKYRYELYEAVSEPIRLARHNDFREANGRTMVHLLLCGFCRDSAPAICAVKAPQWGR